jgi:hypothetical protein
MFPKPAAQAFCGSCLKTRGTRLSADLEDAATVGPPLKYSRFDRGINPTPAEFRAVRAGARPANIDPFSDDPPLELSEYAKHLKHRHSRGHRSIGPCC